MICHFEGHVLVNNCYYFYLVMICIILNMVSKQELLRERVITFWLHSDNNKDRKLSIMGDGQRVGRQM